MDYEGLAGRVERIVDSVERAVSGKRSSIELAVAALLAGGHVLIEDVPGVGKTLLAKSLARAIRGTFRRIQFTPDLLPTDVTGLNVYNQGTGNFDFLAGPVFSNILLADEINRASPKTQSALLEAMEEGAVTVDGETRRLPEPFGVLATQNPIEHEGTYPLPHAELDRFMVKMELGYPDEEAERRMLRLSGDPVMEVEAVVGPEEVLQMRRMVEAVHASEAVLRYVVSVTSATREHEAAYLGASPRASRMLLAAARARAACLGRSYCIPDDVKEMAQSVLGHRIIPASSRMNGHGGPESVTRSIIEDVLRSVPVTEAV
ncbi:MAG: AAA family ATPase [Rubrobacteraceae bacterium]|uniref:AAA family ATPase n=1 Tax=Rubrobacter naiadicus TaxID=1392641 RepID=UPI00235E1595|nr:MoxR family ATPase [Rubrobacter naiadicus]MBX6763796.1 AAA family ATPase [Rubrobacteraceae bacterium]MCL6439211.1 AAA family ATPase [Rubrobacteraceae bacterium]